jgi:hypothetical protein
MDRKSRKGFSSDLRILPEEDESNRYMVAFQHFTYSCAAALLFLICNKYGYMT